MEIEHRENKTPNKPSTYEQFVQTALECIKQPTRGLEKTLQQFPPQIYLTVIRNVSEREDVRIIGATSMRSMMKSSRLERKQARDLFPFLEEIFSSKAKCKIEQRIEGVIESILTTLFQEFWSQEEKLELYQQIFQKVSDLNSIQDSYKKYKLTELSFLVIKSMSAETLDNEITIGQLVVQFRMLYEKKNKDKGGVYGRGFEMMEQVILSGVNEADVQQNEAVHFYFQQQHSMVNIVNEIILEADTLEDEDYRIARQYLEKYSVERLFQSIICYSKGNTIYCFNREINKLKADLIELHKQIYCGVIELPFLQCCLGTIMNLEIPHILDEVESLVSCILMLLERATNEGDYQEFFFNSTQLLVIKILHISSAKAAELSLLSSDPQHFAQIADDYCKDQEMETTKNRAGSLLYHLCLSIDGNLTFVFQFAMISLHYLEKKGTQAAGLSCREQVYNAEGVFKQLLESWFGSSEELIEVSILTLCQLGDLIGKREQLKQLIRNHLVAMIPTFKVQSVPLFSHTVVVRYVQLCSFFSFPGCFDQFMPYYKLHPVYHYILMNCLRILIRHHDKSNPDMKLYIVQMSRQMIRLGETLTPVLESIIYREDIAFAIKQSILEKLVQWMLQFMMEGDNKKSFKISTLITKTIEMYQLGKKRNSTPQNEPSYDIFALTEYLVPLYKHIVNIPKHISEQYIVDIMTAHLQFIGSELTEEQALYFLDFVFKVIENNNGILNNCLYLLNRLICVKDESLTAEDMKYHSFTKTKRDVAQTILTRIGIKLLDLIVEESRFEDLWDYGSIIEICLIVASEDEEFCSRPPSIEVAKIYNIFKHGGQFIVQMKMQKILLLMAEIYQMNYGLRQIVMSMKIKDFIPIYQKKAFTVVLIRLLPIINAQQKVRWLKMILNQFSPSQEYRNYLTNYGNRVYLKGSEAQIYAYQHNDELIKPLQTVDAFREFKLAFKNCNNFENLKNQLTEDMLRIIKNILNQEIIGGKARKIVKIRSAK